MLVTGFRYIPVSLEAAALLAALTHPNHLVPLSSFLCRLAATPMALGIGTGCVYIHGRKVLAHFVHLKTHLVKCHKEE